MKCSYFFNRRIDDQPPTPTQQPSRSRAKERASQPNSASEDFWKLAYPRRQIITTFSCGSAPMVERSILDARSVSSNPPCFLIFGFFFCLLLLYSSVLRVLVILYRYTLLCFVFRPGIFLLVFVLFRPCSSYLFLFRTYVVLLAAFLILHHILQNSYRFFFVFLVLIFLTFSGLACFVVFPYQVR